MIRLSLFLSIFCLSMVWASVVIPEESVLEQLEAALLAQSEHDDLEISYTRTIPPFEINEGEDDTIMIQGVTLKGYRFMMTVFPQHHPEQTTTVAGKMMPLVPIPVLNRLCSPGDTITEADIEWKKEALSRVNKSTITNEQDLIGTSPRFKPLLAHTPLKKTEIHKPHVVKRGDKITLSYEASGLLMTDRGEALENGAQGDMIRVLNATSRKTVQGEVSSHKTIKVYL